MKLHSPMSNMTMCLSCLHRAHRRCRPTALMAYNILQSKNNGRPMTVHIDVLLRPRATRHDKIG